jgi:hypothetical protein
MKFSAYLSGTTATITRQEINNVTALRLDNADSLGSQLLAFIDPNAAPVDTPAYRIDPTDAGLRISAGTGQFDLPWRWITTVGNALT